ncbi:elongation factor Ts [Candidatus Kaiserbacteria bacterium]|nr:MAG: elongation factor Ts [Candidatus Kaiserbacteria bacterium]
MSSTELIKQLRDETGVSIMQCKRALEEAGDDIEKAKVALRKISAQVAAKKADRELAAGTVQAYIHAGNSVAGVVILACETDFVAKNEEFVKIAYDVAMHVAATAPEFVSREQVTEDAVAAARAVFEEEAADKPEEMRAKIVKGKIDSFLKEKVLLEQPFVKNPDTTIQGILDEATQKFGERVEIAEISRFSV